MAYQVKLIEEDSRRVFAEPFHYFHIHIKMWQPNEDQRELHEEFNLQTKPLQNSYLSLCPQLICRRHTTLHPTPLTTKG